MDDVISLIQQTQAQDRNGVWRKTRTSRTVFCQVHSIMRSEFYDAGRNGLNPEFRFVMFHGDYDGESIVEYGGQTYSIYRTYRVPGADQLELYVVRKGGTNGQEDPGGQTG